jgi:phytoene dehydrogenase-like protein
MSKKHDVVIAGAGHNGLTVGCYLAKSGLDVCLLERNPNVGGGVLSTEYAAPGFVTDVCSTIHVLIQGSPIVRNDELGLFSKYGFKYVYPEVQMCIHFHDGTTLSIYKTLEDTCKSIAKFSEKDAESYRRFYQWAAQAMNMIIAGFFAPPPPFGMFVSMLDSSEEGRELLRATMLSAIDVLNDWFENDKVKIALTRWISEIMVMPQTKGTGIAVFVMIGLAHTIPAGLPVGGSGKLSEAMQAFLLDHGATIRTSATVKEFKIEGNTCKGVILEDGEEVLAKKLVVSSLHIKQMFSGMIKGANLPENFANKVQRLKPSSFSCFQQGYALHEPPKYKCSDEDLQKAFVVEFAPNRLEDYLRYFEDLSYGIPAHNPLIACQSIHDPSRAPEGKHTLYFYEYAPYSLKEGGSARWDQIREEYAESEMNFFRQYTTNMGPENIIGRWISSPIDIERHNPAFVHGDFAHLGGFLDQSMGNRPLPGWNYKTPVEKLFMCGPGTHPGSGCHGGGRAAAQAVMEELGIDIEKVV